MQLQPDQATLVMGLLLPQLKNEHKTTLRVIQAAPPDRGDYQPDPRSMTALDLAWHIASADVFFMSLASETPMEGPGKRPETIRTSADVATWYEQNFSKGAEKVAALSGEQLLKEIPFHQFKMTALGFLQLSLVHGVHHRGQLSAYLRPMGGKVPSIYGGSADEPMKEAAAS